MTGHANPAHARIQSTIGRAILCRRDEAAARRSATLLHRALRAGCLTGCRAGTPVSRSVYADLFVHRNIVPPSFPVATLGSQGQI